MQDQKHLDHGEQSIPVPICLKALKGLQDSNWIVSFLLSYAIWYSGIFKLERYLCLVTAQTLTLRLDGRMDKFLHARPTSNWHYMVWH